MKQSPNKLRYLLLGAVAYLPLLATRRGQVVADTKQYLYLDPGGVLTASQSLWDPDWALGTVTHQSIGYLWPMGPFFWTAEKIGLPDWVAQRLWIGSLILLAALGVLWLWKVMELKGNGDFVAALSYGLSPYALAYSTRISVLLLAWAALPWLIGLGIRSTRTRSWRHPALLGLVATSVGSVNASSLVFAGIGVILWFPFAIWVQREISFRDGVAAAGRIGLAVVGCSLWWAGPLVVQSRYGPPVLQFSETLEVVASSASSTEAWRGLGYWVFYGGDKTGPWVSSAVRFMTAPGQILVGFILALVSLISIGTVRWAHRGYLLMLMVAGLGLTIGLHPYERPSVVGSVLRDLGEGSTAGLALRSSPRALPLFLIGAALFTGLAISLIDEHWPQVAKVFRPLVIVLVLINISPLFTGDYVGSELARDEEIPSHWTEAAGDLDGSRDSRILVLPGNDFSAHRWGNTIDHILPGLVDRPVAIRELIGFSSEPASDLLIALDRRLQEGIAEPSSVGPVAALLGAGDVVLQLDLEYERFRTPRPAQLWNDFSADVFGLSEPTAYGDLGTNRAVSDFPLLDEIELGLEAGSSEAPQLAILEVESATGIISATNDVPVLVSGDGEGVVDLAEAGLLLPSRPLLYTGSLDATQLHEALTAGSSVVITDSNRQRARRWKTVRDNVGFTERADGADRVADPTDVRLNVMGRSVTGSATVAQQPGATISASAYGNPISYHPENRPVMAVDGDPSTAWLVAAFSDAQGHVLRIEPDEPIATSSLTVLQPTGPDVDRSIVDLLVRVNDDVVFPVSLDASSLTAPGQSIELPVGRVASLELEIVETSAGRRPGFGGLSAVGFAEVRLGDLVVDEIIVLPTDVVDRIGDDDLQSTDITVLLTRLRTDPANVVRDDTERFMNRLITLPAAREFELSGTARLSARAAGEVIDAETGDALVSGSSFLAGSVNSRPSAALDGDDTTMWQTPFGVQEGNFMAFSLPEAAPSLLARFAVDALHSLPVEVIIESGAGSNLVSVGADGMAILPSLPAGNVRLTVSAVQNRTTINWYSETDIVMPIGLIDIVDSADTARQVTRGAGAGDTECRNDLVKVDGQAVGVRLQRVAYDKFQIHGCSAVAFGAGQTVVTTAVGRDLGIDVDQLVFRSVDESKSVEQPPVVQVLENSRSTRTVEVEPTDSGFWLILAESYNPGWQATVRGGNDLGTARLVQGFANGWHLDATEFTPGEPIVIDLAWAPQRAVRWFFLAGALFCLAGIGLAVLDRRGATSKSWSTPVTLNPGMSAHRNLSTRAVLLTTMAVVAVVGSTTRSGIGLVAGAVVLVSLLAPQRRGIRFVPMVIATGSLGISAAYVVFQVIRYDIGSGGFWPGLFERVHLFGWMALAMLMVELALVITEDRGS